MKQSDNELIKVVMDKIDSLHDLCSKQDPTDNNIRQISADLRFLLVEGNLQKVWRLCGFEKQPKVNPLMNLRKPNNDPALTFSLDDCATTSGATMGGIRIYNRAKSAEEMRADYERERELINAKSEPITMTAYLDSTAMQIKGKKMTRRQIIKYLANKLGGVHYDIKNRDSDLDTLNSQLKLLKKGPLFFTILGIGQAIIKSGDIIKLVKRARG